MKVRIVNFNINSIHPDLLKNFPYDYIYEGAVIDAHFPDADELISYGFEEEEAELLANLMTCEGTVLVDGVPGFDEDPITIENCDYEIVEID
ncbi:hypothetical protein [Escherichia coli]|uniref:hypothetical protein n=1 Tax=Escherichia coli TaxID=562 RepID=UPI000CFBEA40|nr:hypothetical protein [Escherichia coli]